MLIKNVETIKKAGDDNIVGIVGSLIGLKRKGINHVGCCPFHNENTPSFTVDARKGIYKCFGCGASGDSIQFIVEHEGLSFIESIEYIARETGTRVEYEEHQQREEVIRESKERREKESSQLILLDYVQKFFIQQWDKYQILDLMQDNELIDVDGRTFSVAAIKAFGMSYVPNGNIIHSLADTFSWDRKTLKELQLIVDGKNGTYDFFRERIIFPIHDHRNRVVAFSGRKFKDAKKESPKYINSADSAAYNKSEILFGLNLAKREKTEELILVEGYTDVISLWDQGIKNVVASCGTAFTLEQAKLIKRFFKKVIILRDGDDAGAAAAEKDVETAIEAGLNTQIFIFQNKKDDPDSFIRQFGKEILEELLIDNAEDGLIWRVMKEWHETDPFQREIAFKKAGQLLNYLDGDILQEEYLRRLTKKNRMGSVTKILKAAIEQKKEETILKRGKFKLSVQQQNDALQYGIYEANNRYFSCNDPKSGTGVELSNFIVKPIMLIVARNESRRLVEIVNKLNQSFIADVDAKILSDFNRFSTFVEGRGNFLYLAPAKPFHHIKIKMKLYTQMPTCYPIYTMGWHKEGFWTWGNGLTKPDGQFRATNDYGVIEHEGTKYFIRAHSKIDISIKSDDDENSAEDQKNFAYYPNNCIGFDEWTQRMVRVHGSNAIVGICWMMAALFRDILYPVFEFFPHLNGFGPPGAGKSGLAWSFSYMFGATPKGYFHLVHGTDAAFERHLSWVRNGFSWFDEYSNDVSFERVEALKKAYDGGGREKAKGAYGHTMTRSPINSAICVTGQQQPTQDNALFQRCISMSFPKKDRSLDDNKAFQELRKIEQSGQLTQLVGQIIKHRDLVATNFVKEFDDLRTSFKNSLKQDNLSGSEVDRMMSNYLIPVATYACLKDVLPFSFDYEQVIGTAYDMLVKQIDCVHEEDEMSTFWRIVDYLLSPSKSTLHHGTDILVQWKNQETFMDDEERKARKNTITKSWFKQKKLVYVNFTATHREYMNEHAKNKGKKGLQLKALQYYLQGSKAYMGQKHGKKFGKSSKSCMVFDTDLLPISLETSAEARANDIG